MSSCSINPVLSLQIVDMYQIACRFCQLIFYILAIVFINSILYIIYSSKMNSPLRQSTNIYMTVKELVQDIQNKRLKDLILNYKNVDRLIDDDGKAKRKNINDNLKDSCVYLKQYEQRKWLSNKGKSYLIDFNNQERRQMKHYFNSLDQNKTGSIGIDQLEQFLLSVGLFQTRQQIKNLIDSVDQDHSGKIQFGQFLSMIQNDEGQNEQIVKFFKTVIGGKTSFKSNKNPYYKKQQNSKQPNKNQNTSITQEVLKKYPYPKGLSFEMVVSHIRRKYMMAALNIGQSQKKLNKSQKSQNSLNRSERTSNPVEQIAKGQQVMQSLQKMYERKFIKQIKDNKRGLNSRRLNIQLSSKESK